MQKNLFRMTFYHISLKRFSDSNQPSVGMFLNFNLRDLYEHHTNPDIIPLYKNHYRYGNSQAVFHVRSMEYICTQNIFVFYICKRIA